VTHVHSHPVVDNEHAEQQEHDHGPAGRHPHRHTTLGLAPSHSDAPNNATTTDIVLGLEQTPWRDATREALTLPSDTHSHKTEVGGVAATLTHAHLGGHRWHEHVDAPHAGESPADLADQVRRLVEERDRLFHAGERLVRSVTTVIGADSPGRGGTVRPALEEFRATLIDVARRNG
jgi:hypothetical protein